VYKRPYMVNGKKRQIIVDGNSSLVSPIALGEEE
jgi:hypothetical protein